MVRHPNRHLDEADIEKYSMGDLRELEVAAFEEHLLICERCQQLLVETDDYVASMKGAAAHWRQRQGLGRTESVRWKALRVFAGVAAIAVLVIVIGWWSGNSDVTGSAPFAVNLQATRGAAIAAYAPAGTWLLVRLDLAGLPNLPSYRLEMVNSAGTVIWHGSATAVDAKAESKIPGTGAGIYFIRVYTPSGEALREFGLKIRDR